MPYKTMQGKELDLDKLRIKNELTLAVGNVPMNARGDELGPGGRVVRKREDVMTEYHQSANAVPSRPASPKPQAKAPIEQNLEMDDEFDPEDK